MLPAPGSPTYLPALLAHIQTEIRAGGDEWVIDPALLSTLLLSQIAGPKNGGIIVDVLPSESGMRGSRIEKVVNTVQALSEGIFGLETHHIHLTRHTHPSELSKLLFIDPPEHWISPPSRRTSTPGIISPSRQPRRSTISTPSSKYTSALASPVFPRSRRGTHSLATTPGVTPGITPKNSVPLLRPAILGSGMDYGFEASLIPSQTGQYATSFNNGGQGSGGHGMRLPQCIVISGMERAESSVWGKLVNTLLKGYIELHEEDTQEETREELVSESRELGPSSGGSAIRKAKWDFPEGFWLIWVREEEKSEKCRSWLIDQFGMSICVHPDDLDTPPKLPQRSIMTPQHIRSLNSILPYTHIHPPLQTHISNLVSSLSTHPRLHSAITGRAVLGFPEYIKAHRLISAQFTLPEGWEAAAQTRDEVEGAARASLGGIIPRLRKQDEGWVDTWGILAGEGPDPSELASGKILEGDSDSWNLDCQMGNIEAVFALALRHRISWRKQRDEVMWLLKGSAVQSCLSQVKGAPTLGASGGVAGIEEKKKEKRRERRRRRDVDVILEEVMSIV